MHTRKQHIPQPPHTAGEGYKGLRARVDLSQVPSLVDDIEADQEKWNDKPYMTLPGSSAPLASTEFTAIDQGNSSPKFARVSTWHLPSTSRISAACQIPIGAIFQPFADLNAHEETVPLVQTGESGPARCLGCRGYINPWCRWMNEGNKWKCNLCGHETEVNPEYFCNLDANQLRLDHLQRPELCKGTIDFTVPKEYWASHPPVKMNDSDSGRQPRTEQREPEAMKFVFVFDVSVEAVRSGFLRAVCETLSKLIFDEQEGCFPGLSSLCFITFDRTLHFYDLTSKQEPAPMLVVGDIDDVFVPLHDNLFVRKKEHGLAILNFFNTLPARFEDTTVHDAVVGSALRGSVESLVGYGGQALLFLCTMPNAGPGKLSPDLDEQKLFDTANEPNLFKPREDFWPAIGEECAEEGVGVHLFLGMNRPIDIGSIGTVASTTGGDIYFHPRFDSVRDTIVLHSQLRRLFTRQTGYNCAMRVRCSKGLRVSEYLGNFYRRSMSDVELGTFDSDKAVAVTIEHSGSLDQREFAFLQCALLYTTTFGERRVRTCNLALSVASLAANVFKNGAIDSTICYLARAAVERLSSQKAASIREDLTDQCSKLLMGYRVNCAASSRPTQLILPESFRTIPVATLALLKCKPLKARNVAADVRNYVKHKILAMGVADLMRYIYPRLTALHDLDNTTAIPDAVGRISWPSSMRNSHICMEGHGLYLIDNGEINIIWVGASVSPQLLVDLFGTEDIMNLDTQINLLPNFPTLISTQVRNIIAHNKLRTGRHAKLFIVRQNMDGMEIEFSDMLVEDQNNANMSVTDFMSVFHHQISTALANGGTLDAGSAFRTSPWWQ